MYKIRKEPVGNGKGSLGQMTERCTSDCSEVNLHAVDK